MMVASAESENCGNRDSSSKMRLHGIFHFFNYFGGNFSEQEIEEIQSQGISAIKNARPKPIEDLSYSENKKKRLKPHENNDEICDLSIGTFLAQNIVARLGQSLESPVVDFSKQETEVLQVHVEEISTTKYSESPNLIEDLSCAEKKQKTDTKKSQEPNGINDQICHISVGTSLMDTECKETKIDEVHSLSPLASKADIDVDAIVKEGNLLQMANSSIERCLLGYPQKKLLILDINGLLADLVGMECSIPSIYNSYGIISGRKGDNLYLNMFRIAMIFYSSALTDSMWVCGLQETRKLHSRTYVPIFLSCFLIYDLLLLFFRKNTDSVVDYLFRDSKHKLLFCWNQSHCTKTRLHTLENRNKPLFLKELRKLWEKLEPDLLWARGEYNESNTILLDDSPSKALRNPVNSAIFPNSYEFKNIGDSSLGPQGDIRSYLEKLSMAENVQKYVEHNPFGQQPITKSNPSWNYYRSVIEDEAPLR